MRQLGIAYIPSPCHCGTFLLQTILEIIFDLWKVMKKFATNNTNKHLRIPPHQQRGNAQLDNMLFKEVLPWLLPQKSLINDWAQIAPKNIINQPGNREVEGRLERKIGAGINFIATLKMIIFPTTPYLASRSICVRFEGQIHIADRNEKTSFDNPYDYGVVFFSQEKNKPSEEVIQWNGGTFIENIKGGQHWTAQEIEAYRFSFSIVDWYPSLGYIYSVKKSSIPFYLTFHTKLKLSPDFATLPKSK